MNTYIRTQTSIKDELTNMQKKYTNAVAVKEWQKVAQNLSQCFTQIAWEKSIQACSELSVLCYLIFSSLMIH